MTEANCLVDWNTEKLLKKFLSCDKALFYSLTVRYSQWSHYKTVSYVICKLSGTFCTLQVYRMSYSHWLNVMSGTCWHCYCSYGSAQNMKHYSWVGLLLGYYSTAWPLSPNYSKRQQCCATEWMTFHCKYRNDRAKARPQKRCHVNYKHVVQKETRHCITAALPISMQLIFGRLLKGLPSYHTTRNSTIVDRPCDALCQSKSCQMLHN